MTPWFYTAELGGHDAHKRFSAEELGALWNGMAAYVADLEETIEEAEGNGEAVPALRAELSLARGLEAELAGHHARDAAQVRE